jgi:medium-chain acyl-[acyl-carrier-protein] hydrolase
MAPTAAWLAPLVQRDAPRLRLVGIPHCGGGSSLFRTWPAGLPDTIEVWTARLPGRDERVDEPASRDLSMAADAMAAALRGIARPCPLVLFGHSLGALVAFEVTRRLERDGAAPALLVVSACAAPQIARTAPPIHRLPDQAFLDAVKIFGGLPDEILEDDEMRAHILPVLRADFEMCETYAYQARLPLQVPITAIGGMADRAVERRSLEAWREQTAGRFALNLLPGGHFYLREETLLFRTLTRELAALPAARR